MTRIDIGPHTRDEPEARSATTETTETFDREIDLKAIAWAVGGLVAVALVVHLLIWWTVEGFEKLDKRRDVRPTPIEAAVPQAPPPEPRLQVSPEVDLLQVRQEEDLSLTQPAWTDRAQGRVRVPLDVAMEVIARRGLGADVVGGQPGAVPSTPEQMRQSGARTSPGAPGATVQMSRPRTPHPPAPPLPSPPTPPGEGGNRSRKLVSPLPVEGGAMGEGPGVRGPAPQERPL